jgi:hypothetical protein
MSVRINVRVHVNVNVRIRIHGHIAMHIAPQMPTRIRVRIDVRIPEGQPRHGVNAKVKQGHREWRYKHQVPPAHYPFQSHRSTPLSL